MRLIHDGNIVSVLGWVIVGAWSPRVWRLREGILMFRTGVTLALHRVEHTPWTWKHKPWHKTPLGIVAGEVIIGENYTLWQWHGMATENTENKVGKTEPERHTRCVWMLCLYHHDMVTWQRDKANHSVSGILWHPRDTDNAMWIQ